MVVLEKQERIGGWCNTINVRVEEKETAVTSEGRPKELAFETGVRSIRPVGLMGWLTIEMVRPVLIATPAELMRTSTGPHNRPHALDPHCAEDRPLGEEPLHLRAAITGPYQASLLPPLGRQSRFHYPSYPINLTGHAP